MKVRPIPDTAILPDGVYLGLPEERYFFQDALGSTDFGKLWSAREGWWWQSKHNSFAQRQTNKATAFGSASHVLFLEGREPFKERFFVEPDRRHFPDLLVTMDDIVSALEAGGHQLPPRRASKPDVVEFAKVYLPNRYIWDDILAKALRQAGKRTVLSAEDAFHLEVMLEAAMADPDMRAVVAADDGVPLTEVSVFLTLADGLRLRFRFDTLLPTLNADLKTIDNFREKDLAHAVGKQIGDSALDVQAAMSFMVRRYAYAHILAGNVYGGTKDQVKWLARFPKEAPLDGGDKPGWSWRWLFYQKPDNSGRAPVIMPVTMEFGSLAHLDGWRKLLHALAFYRQQVATVGLDKPWTRVAPLHYMDDVKNNRVAIPHWVEQPMRVDGEEEGLTWKVG